LQQNNSLIYLDEEIKSVQEKITNELNTTLIDKGDDFIVSNEKMTYAITTQKIKKAKSKIM